MEELNEWGRTQKQQNRIDTIMTVFECLSPIIGIMIICVIFLIAIKLNDRN